MVTKQGGLYIDTESLNSHGHNFIQRFLFVIIYLMFRRCSCGESLGLFILEGYSIKFRHRINLVFASRNILHLLAFILIYIQARVSSLNGLSMNNVVDLAIGPLNPLLCAI